MMGHDSFTLQYFTDILPDSFNMPLGISGADDEVVCERTQGSNVQQGNIPCLLLRCKLGGQARYFLRFQKASNLLLYYTTYGKI